ncbi:acyl-CoA dehydrogenase family protein [Herbiconiux sp. SYSU D00978]|uniref:acyl-CoA dehydrogenase family protein n=1 Tax=Herbiconiux sp. SYSU D00978 TaxID=2812562 RepID=UPI001A963D1D|nr:acyl-CoA dehydrogenase family protein [Herbiconiux sp. SYSU D00978]
MTTTIHDPATDRAAFDAFLDRLRAGACDREANRTLLHAEIEELRALGFASWRLPPELGGAGLGFEELIARVIDLAAADASLGHLVRGHVAFVEQLLADGLGTRPLTERERRWVARLNRGEFVGNAQSERQETAVLSTRLDTDGGVLRLTGTKYYTTGSIYADWIHLAALDGDERVAVTVDARQPGVRSIDDWDGFGQLLTGSGTTTFDGALVDPEDVERSAGTPGAWNHLGVVFQLVLLAAIAGIARTALDDAVAYVRPRRRTFGFAGETPPREDPLVQQVVGRLSSVALSARELVLGVARRADAALEGLRAGRLGPDDLQPVLLDVYRIQQVVPPLVLDATTELFEVGGASAVSRTTALDRHWRNVRTIASHNPAAQRARALGQFELLGTLPAWSAPGAPARDPETTS